MDEEGSPFKIVAAMNLTDASGNGTRIDDFLLARLIAEDAHLPYFKIDPLKLDVEMVESRISRPFARKHKMVPVAIRDGKLVVSPWLSTRSGPWPSRTWTSSSPPRAT